MPNENNKKSDSSMFKAMCNKRGLSANCNLFLSIAIDFLMPIECFNLVATVMLMCE